MTPEQQQMLETVKTAGDFVAIPTAIGFAVGLVQLAAGLLAVAYTLYRIYDLWDKRRKRMQKVSESETLRD